MFKRIMTLLLAAVLMLGICLPAQASGTGEVTLVEQDGSLYCMKDGELYNVTTLIDWNDRQWYVADGKVASDFTGTVEFEGESWYVKNGNVASDTTGLVKIGDEYWYVKNGKLATSTTGLVKHNNAWWYVISGKLASDFTGPVEHYGQYWYVKNGMVTSNATTLVKIGDEYWYVKNGKLATSTTGLVKHNNAWWYVISGKLASDFTGPVEHYGQYWYVKNGMVTSNATTLVKIGDEYWYIKNGKIASATTGLVKFSGGYWYVKQGKVCPDTTMVKCNNEWWYLVKGKVAASVTTLIYWNGSWWYVKNGKVASATTTVVKFNGSRWYVVNGRVAKEYSGPMQWGCYQWECVNGKVISCITAPGVTEPPASDTSITLSFTGDCTLGSNQKHTYPGSFHQYYDQNGPDYFLASVRSIFEHDDITVVNLEGSLTNSKDIQPKQWNHKGPPKYVRILSGSSVEVATMGNNHRVDYGYSGFVETKKTLDAAGISYCYDSTYLAYTVKGIKIGFVSVNEVYEGTTVMKYLKEGYAYLKSQGCAAVVACLHWGGDKTTVLENTQLNMGCQLIDMGYDLVVGNHPHILQAMRIYKGKFICYSLGNFCYGGNKNPPDKDSGIFQQTFHFKDGVLQPKIDARFIPCYLSSKSTTNTYQPTPAYGNEALRIIRKINGYSSRFGLTLDSQGRPVL